MASSLLLAVLAVLPAFAADASSGDKRQAFRLWDEGISATLKDRPEEARAKWRECLELDADNRDCRAGLKLLGASTPAGSVAVAAPEPSSEKNEAKRLMEEGNAHFDKDRYQEASRFYQECLKLDPKNHACYAGFMLSSGGRRPTVAASSSAVASSLSQPASAGVPVGSKSARKLWGEGLVHFQKMQYANAAKSWQDCLRKDPENSDCSAGLSRVMDYLPKHVVVPGAAAQGAPVDEPAAPSGDEGRKRAALRHWHAGIIYFQAGKHAQARDEWRLCAEFDPANTDCSTGLDRIDSLP